ncbi:hypothetical protein HPP92_000873 [Vanilla planifolia]|uniref:Uncharacterized protein n=1 Tax=Vanilla planifolia TaxID=51239 RepID=A0A835S2A4_VANPL|nr:hypothetical protein HPP92_000873 [Vanilla planifolia]
MAGSKSSKKQMKKLKKVMNVSSTELMSIGNKGNEGDSAEEQSIVLAVEDQGSANAFSLQSREHVKNARNMLGNMWSKE